MTLKGIKEVLSFILLVLATIAFAQDRKLDAIFLAVMAAINDIRKETL